MAQYGYGYLDMGDGYALVQIQPGQKTGVTLYDGAEISLRGKRLMPVARQWARIKRAPTVIWKPGVSADVKYAVDIEMVDLQGGALGAGGGSSVAPVMAVAALALVGGIGYALYNAGAFA